MWLPIGSGMMAAAPNVSYTGLPGTGIALVPPTSPEFLAALRVSADPQAVSSIQPILPYSVMVKNSTAERLLMVTVRLYLKEPSGRRVWHDVTQGTRNNEPVEMIAPGSMVLITPEGGLNTVLPRAIPMHIPEGERLASRLTDLVALYERQSEVEIALDSVVFEDGGVIGPDRSRTMAMVNSWADAEDNVVSEVTSRHGDDVASYLVSARDTPAPRAAALEKRDEFAERRRSFADELLNQRKAFTSEEAFFVYLRTKAESRIPKLKRRN